MKLLAGIILLMLFMQSCSSLKTVDGSNNKRQVFNTHYLVIKVTGNTSSLIELLVLIEKYDCINNALLNDNERFLLSTKIFAVTIRVWSQAQINRIICLLNTCPVDIISINEM